MVDAPGFIRRFQQCRDRAAFLRQYAYELRTGWSMSDRERAERLAVAYGARVSASQLER